MLAYLQVFAYGLVIDWAYVLWVRYVASGAKGKAAIASVAVAAPGVFGITAIVSDRILAIPYLVGLFVGTYSCLVISSRGVASVEQCPVAPAGPCQKPTGTSTSLPHPGHGVSQECDLSRGT